MRLKRGAERLSRPIRMKYCINGELTYDEVTSEFSESYFTLVKHKRHRKATSVQKAEDYKTLICMLLGEMTFAIRPDCIFVNL
jgi:hypothetical protein